jgi:hypothetical protein
MRNIGPFVAFLLLASTAGATPTLQNREYCLDFTDDRNLNANGYSRFKEGDGYTIWGDEASTEIIYYKGSCDKDDMCEWRSFFAKFKILRTKMYVIERYDNLHEDRFLYYFYNSLYGAFDISVLSHNIKGYYKFTKAEPNNISEAVKDCLKIE